MSMEIYAQFNGATIIQQGRCIFMIKSYSSLRERCEIFAAYLIENNSTVRQTASYFGISKSTVHKDLSNKLKHVNPSLFEQTKSVLETNKAERHIRGGQATKQKYLTMHKQK